NTTEHPMHTFERACPSGWIYPCTLADLQQRLAELPDEDLDDLWAVGLVPSTKKDWSANARYLFGQKPTIHIYSYPDILRYRLLPHTKPGNIQRGLAVELQFGMVVEEEGGRYGCQWSAANLRRFIVEHVLLHEVGHHVYNMQRRRQGLAYRPCTRESEQFAEA